MSRRKPTNDEWLTRKCAKCRNHIWGNDAADGYGGYRGVDTPECCGIADIELGTPRCGHYSPDKEHGGER